MPLLLGKKSWRAWAEWVGRAMTDSSLRKPKVVLCRAEPLRKKNGWTARAERYRVRECEAAIRAEWFGDVVSGPMRA